jgi:DNA invertase Pin-like site-specific DNA recombinase
MPVDAPKQSQSKTSVRRKPLPKLAVGYARVSTSGQGDNGISLDAQKVAIKDFAEHAGYTLVEVFEDVASGMGARSFADRKGLRQALAFASREGSDLIVWDWDRLSRYSSFERQILKHLPEGSKVICAKDGTLLSDAAKNSAFKHSEVVGSEISRRTKARMEKMRLEGAVFGNPEIRDKVQPLGVDAWSKTAKEQDLRIADLLRGLPDPFAPTHAQVADLLNEKGLLTLHGKEWNKSRVRQPVSRARQILRAEENMKHETDPRFGIF